MSYRCDACKIVFEEAPGDLEAALAEKSADFPNDPLEECGRVCHDCYMKYVGKLKN